MNTQKTTMKSLPASERPYEKCEAYGPAALSDAELLAVILRSGTRSVTSLELAQKLLLQFGARRGLGFLREVTRAELLAVPGIGSVKATELLAAGELSRRIARAEKRGEISLGRPKAIASYFMEDLCYLDHEEMWVAMFNTKNKLIPPPEKKKYSRDHLLLLIYVYYLKDFLQISDIQTLLQPLEEHFFQKDGELSMPDIYETAVEIVSGQKEEMMKDLVRRFEIARKAFPEAEKDEENYLQIFSFVTLLSFDVYVKKKLIESIVDQMLQKESGRSDKKDKKD